MTLDLEDEAWCLERYDLAFKLGRYPHSSRRDFYHTYMMTPVHGMNHNQGGLWLLYISRVG